MEEELATTFLTGLDIGWPRSFTSASGVLGSALRYRNVFAGVGTAASHASNSHQLRQLLGRGAHTGDDNAGSDAGTQCASRRVSSNTFRGAPFKLIELHSVPPPATAALQDITSEDQLGVLE